MFCPTCGKPLPPSSACPSCGPLVDRGNLTLTDSRLGDTVMAPRREVHRSTLHETVADPFVRPFAISVLAVLHGIGAALWLFAALGCALLLATGGDPVTSAVGVVVLGGFGAAQLACGVGLWRLRPSGRTLALVFAWVGLLGVPLGTLVSALVLYYLFRPGIKVLFSGLSPDSLTDEDRAQVAAVSRHSTAVIVVVIVLIVLCLVAVIGIVAAMAIPGLLRAKVAASETSAIGSLRAVFSGQALYSSSCGGGSYAPSLTLLGVPPTGGGAAFVAPDMAVDPAVKSGYTFTMTPGPTAPGAPASCNGAPAGTLVETFFVSAVPTGVPGGRFFGVSQDGTVYQSASDMPVTPRGTPPGATPIR